MYKIEENHDKSFLCRDCLEKEHKETIAEVRVSENNGLRFTGFCGKHLEQYKVKGEK